MAVSPLDPQSVRLTIASDIANRLSMLFVVHTQMGGWGDNTDMVCCLKQLISLVFFGGRTTSCYPSGCLCRARVPLFSVQPCNPICLCLHYKILFVLDDYCVRISFWLLSPTYTRQLCCQQQCCLVYNGSNFSVTSNNTATHSMMWLMKHKHVL